MLSRVTSTKIRSILLFIPPLNGLYAAGVGSNRASAARELETQLRVKSSRVATDQTPAVSQSQSP